MINSGRTAIRDILGTVAIGTEVTLWGWIRTARVSKSVVFVQVNDGSCLASVQLVAEPEQLSPETRAALLTGACIRATGVVRESPGAGQAREVALSTLDVVGPADVTYPLQKKRHTLEFLRTMPHLRGRTNTFLATFRMRNALAFAIHSFFQSRGFTYVHTPVLTGSDCEGAGEMFRATTLDPAAGAKPPSEDYFGKPVFLTVSGQLEGECFALSHGEIYTFGPTFRADPSDTARHAAEFWMIEPEMAFYDLDDNLKLIEDFVKSITAAVRDRCPAEIQFLAQNVEPELSQRYEAILSGPFARIDFADAVALLNRHPDRFEEPAKPDADLRTEHERFLTDEWFKGPVFVTNYPTSFKPFYMRVNEGGRTVACLDLLVPGIGEIMSGSQREERLDVLQRRIVELGMDPELYDWYVQTRRWGSAPHAGFGLGFERMLMYLSGVKNIRDVMPFPRNYKQIVP